ncbi:UNVERIFIED_CONTAM: hypothetical protein Sradi_4876700 [Sesamum radiatum]|uniref:Uncharacterized protein n=1 Tax=Sesamum radiatum TaxID=300843 RepID=A0AAW2N0E2_SESRA
MNAAGKWVCNWGFGAAAGLCRWVCRSGFGRRWVRGGDGHGRGFEAVAGTGKTEGKLKKKKANGS